MKAHLYPYRILALAAVLALGTGLWTSTDAVAQERTFIPLGHAYKPGSSRLPHPNSRLGRLEAQTDIYETEIYRRQLEDSRSQERFKRFIDHDFFAGQSYSDY